jgi:hypothetical protein
MYTLLNWCTTAPYAITSPLLALFTLLALLLPWSIARWRNRHGALPTTHKAPLWKALLGALAAFLLAFIPIGIMVFACVVWPWAHSNNNHGQGDDFATGVIFSTTLPLDCLLSALVYRAIRWKRVPAVADPIALAGSGAPPAVS